MGIEVMDEEALLAAKKALKAAEEKLNRKIKKRVWNAINEFEML